MRAATDGLRCDGAPGADGGATVGGSPRADRLGGIPEAATAAAAAAAAAPGDAVAAPTPGFAYGWNLEPPESELAMLLAA